MTKAKLLNILSGSIEEGLTTLKVSSENILKDKRLRTSHNLATISQLSKDLSLLLYLFNSINKLRPDVDIDFVLDQSVASIERISSCILDLFERSLVDKIRNNNF